MCSHTHLCSFHVLATRHQCKLALLTRLVRLRGCMPTLGLPRCATTPQQQPQTQPWLCWPGLPGSIFIFYFPFQHFFWMMESSREKR